MVKKLLPYLLLVLLGVQFWHAGERFDTHNGPTFDEAVHLVAGRSYWATGDFRINIEDPPLPKLLWAIPSVFDTRFPFQPDAEQWANNEQWKLGNAYLFSAPGSAEALLAPARRMNRIFGFGIILVLALWGRRLFENWLPALLSATLAAFDPTLIALANILSSDAALAFFTLTSAWLIWEYARTPRTELMIAIGLNLGGLLASKFSAVFVILGFLLAIAVYLWRGGSFDPNAKTTRERWASALTPGVRITIIALVTLAASYGFLRFPDWGVGFKQQLLRAETGDPHFYFLGEVRTHGSPWYFFVCLALKLPIGALALMLLGCLRRISTDRLALLLVPPIVFFACITTSGVNLGIRIVLPVLPFLWLLAGRAALPGRTVSVRLLFVVGAIFWIMQSTRTQIPYHLSYFNDFARTDAERMKLLGDSNLDWGQGNTIIAQRSWEDSFEYEVFISPYGTGPQGITTRMRGHRLPGYGLLDIQPDVFNIPGTRPIRVYISASNLQGIYLNDPQAFGFLRERPPEAVLLRSVWVYQFMPNDPAVAQLRALVIPPVKRD